MYSAAFNNIPAFFTPDHISHYFHHARHLQSIIGAHIIFWAANSIFQGSYRRHSQDLESKLFIPERNQLIVDTYLKYVNGKKTVIFCASVDHAAEIAKLLRDSGVKAEAGWNGVEKGTKRANQHRNSATFRYRREYGWCIESTEGMRQPSIISSNGLFVDFLNFTWIVSNNKKNGRTSNWSSAIFLLSVP